MKSLFAGISLVVFCGAAVAAGVPAALHGKSGTYMVRTNSNIPLFRDHNLKHLSAAEQAKISAHLLGISGKHFTYCVAENPTSGFGRLIGLGPQCAFSNEKTTNGVFSADAVCSKNISMHLTLTKGSDSDSRLHVEFKNIRDASLPMVINYELRYKASGCYARIGPNTMHDLDNGRILTLK